MNKTLMIIFTALVFTAAACGPLPETAAPAPAETEIEPTPSPSPLPQPTPYPTRPRYAPGELVDYTAQTGDSLDALAVRFNTSVAEIRAANPIIPDGATTMPPGLPMQIPIYYLPLWGSPYQILPDWRFVNGPSAVTFDSTAFVDSQPGWLKDLVQFVAGRNRRGGEIIDYVAANFSVDPRLLLALVEYQVRGLSSPDRPANLDTYPLGYRNTSNQGLYLQLVWAANRLNDGYYRWRIGTLPEFDLLGGELERPDPWQNAGTVAIQYYFAALSPSDRYHFDISAEGLAGSYRDLFGDPWAEDAPHLPGSLAQPELQLPFEARKPWTYTGGPHTGWGTGAPFAALDFAPPSTSSGCFESNDWATAAAAGVVVRSETGIVVLDLDSDGDERTGWVLFYLHLATKDRAEVGLAVEKGEPLGHPSCEGGTSTGSHIHIARKYNGEWMPAGAGVLPFNLEGWVARDGTAAYRGTLVRGNQVVTACECSNLESQLSSGE